MSALSTKTWNLSPTICCARCKSLRRKPGHGADPSAHCELLWGRDVTQPAPKRPKGGSNHVCSLCVSRSSSKTFSRENAVFLFLRTRRTASHHLSRESTLPAARIAKMTSLVCNFPQTSVPTGGETTTTSRSALHAFGGVTAGFASTLSCSLFLGFSRPFSAGLVKPLFCHIVLYSCSLFF